jgi:integrase
LNRRLTVAAAADRWLATRIATGRNPHNQRKARARAEIYLKPFMGHRPITTVTADDLREYRIWLEALPGVHGRAHLATATIAWILGDAKNLFYWAVDAGFVDRNPVPRRLLPRIQERPPDHMNDADIAAILAIPEPHAFVIRLALGTGLRWSELCRARTTDLQDGMLVVHHTKSYRDGSCRFRYRC